MKKDWKMYLTLCIAFVCIGLMSCGSMLDKVTPANIPERSLDYIDKEPNDVANLFGINSLYDAKIVKDEITIKHRTTQKEFLRMVEDDKLDFGDATGLIAQAVAESQAGQDLMIGAKDQPISILGIMASVGLGTGGLLLGKNKFHAKGDVTKDVHEAELKAAYEQGKNEA